MRFQEHLDFVSDDEIRLRGTRIGIETIVTEYLDGRLPEEIAQDYPSLSMEQVRAAIAYYQRNRKAVEEYLARLDAWSEAQRQEQAVAGEPPAAQRLRRRAAQVT